MTACGACGVPLETPLVCGACGALAEPAAPPTPFEVLGLEPSFALDAAVLKKRLLGLTRSMHPDFFAADPTQRELAERNTAELNAAHAVLSEDARRADWLVRWRGGPDEQAERQMPQEFLMEVLEWNEALEEARAAAPGSPTRELAGLRSELEDRRAACFAELGSLLTPLPPPGDPALTEARRRLNAVRYLDRALTELSTLAATQPAG